MNLSFDLSPLRRSRLFILAYMIAIMTLASSIAKLFLPDSSIEQRVLEPFNFVRSYPFDRAFSVANAPGAATPIQQAASASAATLTGLKIKAIYAEQDKSGFIVLEDSGKLVFVATGENIRGYTLKEVEAKRAIFELGGISYELKLIEKEFDVTIGSEANSDTPQVKQSVTKDELARYKTNTRLIWDNIGIKPISENGTFKEFRVTFVKHGSVFADLGLQAGDVIKEVNGIAMNGYAAAMRIYNDIDKIDLLKLTIMRNNQEKELRYEIR
ncbi:MAG: hypothetical protein LBN32_03610 [Helicobacteraceae bacterium]|jgi:type II secretion system protein C|nr:hypothetical protein [Helicobacteraceae bacterium]